MFIRQILGLNNKNTSYVFKIIGFIHIFIGWTQVIDVSHVFLWGASIFFEKLYVRTDSEEKGVILQIVR